VQCFSTDGRFPIGRTSINDLYITNLYIIVKICFLENDKLCCVLSWEYSLAKWLFRLKMEKVNLTITGNTMCRQPYGKKVPCKHVWIFPQAYVVENRNNNVTVYVTDNDVISCLRKMLVAVKINLDALEVDGSETLTLISGLFTPFSDRKVQS
jgi:hypothetical protein